MHSHDFRIDNLEAPPISDATTERAMPRTQSWADTTASEDDIVLSGEGHLGRFVATERERREEAEGRGKEESHAAITSLY